MPNAIVNILAAVVFGIALVHTFVDQAAREAVAPLAATMPGCSTCSARSRCVFGFWAMVLVALMAVVAGSADALAYAESREYTEPLFVFVVMVVAASRPVLQVVRALVVDAGARRAGARRRWRRPGWAWPSCRCSARSSPSRRR